MKNLKNFTTGSIFWILSFFFAVNSFAGVIPGPELLSPANGSMNIPVTPTLMWSSMPNAVKYALEVSTDDKFGNIVYSDANLKGTSISLDPGFLSNNITYYWRVNYTDIKDITSDWSNAVTFTTIIGSPALTVPVNNAVGQSLTTELIWKEVAGADMYTLEISTDPQFNTTIVNEQGIFTTGYSVSSGILSVNTQYFWRVQAVNKGGQGAFSSAFTFTTYTLPVMNVAIPKGVIIGADWQTFTSTIVNEVTGGTFTNLSVPYEFGTSSALQQGDIMVEYFDGSKWVSLELTESDGKLVGIFGGQGFPLFPGQTFDISMRIKAGEKAFIGEYGLHVVLNNNGVKPIEQIAEFTGNFNVLMAVPTVPVLQSPKNGAVSQPLDAVLDWDDVLNTDTYDVQVSTDAQFINMVITETGVQTSDYSISSGILTNGTEYFWRVRGINTSGAGEYAEAYSFRTIAGDPTVPVLISPVNGLTGLPLIFTLEWSEAQNAESYEVQISKDTTFESPLFEETNIVSTDLTIPSGVLTNGHWYYWRVRSVNLNGSSEYSDMFSFRTISATPMIPVLLTPSNGSNGVPVITTFDWEDVSVAEKYSIEIAEDSTFSNIVMEEDSLGVSEYTNTEAMAKNTTYYWRVNASNKGGTGEYSSVFQFTTESLQPPAPVLLTPKNGAPNIELTPTLDWNDIVTDNLESVYEIEIALDEEFTEVIFAKSGLGISEYSVESPLAQRTEHFWRIKFHTESGSSEWSEAWSFTTTVLTGLTNAGSEIPKVYELNQNYPNPFNPSTKVRFGIPQTGNGIQNATIVVYNMIGQVVANLFNGQLTAGMYEVQFDASGLSSGTYFYELRTDNFRSVKRMTLIK